MAELGDFMVSQDPEGDITKDVTVDMLDYKFVEECTDPKKLKLVLSVLKSGKEGFYPELIKATEEKLLTLLPAKERQTIMRMKVQASPAEVMEAESGLDAWQNKISSTVKANETKSTTLKNKKGLPPVRGGLMPTTTDNETSSNGTLSAADQHESNLRLADREKQKGNEFFKAGELEAATACYTLSIEYDGTNAVIWANRAMSYLKSDLLDKSEADCTKSLSIDPLYVKAWSRRGLTRFKQGRYNESATDFYRALELDPDNKELPQLLQRAKDKFLEVEGRGEWHPSSSSSSLSSSSSRGGQVVQSSTVTQGHTKPAETNVLSASSAAPAIVTSTETVISHLNVSTAGELFLPSHSATMVTSGTCEILTVNPSTTRSDYGSPINGDGSSASASAGFTRVAISFDDDDDEDLEEEEEETEQPTALSSPQQPPSPQKIKVCDEQKVQTIPAATMTAATAANVIESELPPPPSFTRMQIVVEDDSIDEEKSAASSSTAADTAAAVLPNDVISEHSLCSLAPPTVASGSHSPSMAALLRTLVELDVKLKDTPQDDSLRRERTKVAQLVRDMEKKIAAASLSPVSASVPAAVVKDEASNAVSSAIPPTPNTKVDVSASVTPPLPPSTKSTPTPSSTAPSSTVASVATTTASKPKTISQRVPVVPTEAPKTMYEFERIWRGLKDRPALFALYLGTFQKKTDVKKVMKEAVSSELMSSMFKALRDHAPPAVVVTVLGGLSMASHFSMTLAMMEDEDVQCIKTIFFNLLNPLQIGKDQISAGTECTAAAEPALMTSLQQLKSIYKV